MRKSKKVFELAISFWAGIGLMSMINIWKTVYTKKTLLYDWIMFFVSAAFIVVGVVYLIAMDKKQHY